MRLTVPKLIPVLLLTLAMFAPGCGEAAFPRKFTETEDFLAMKNATDPDEMLGSAMTLLDNPKASAQDVLYHGVQLPLFHERHLSVVALMDKGYARAIEQRLSAGGQQRSRTDFRIESTLPGVAEDLLNAEASLDAAARYFAETVTLRQALRSPDQPVSEQVLQQDREFELLVSFCEDQFDVLEDDEFTARLESLYPADLSKRPSDDVIQALVYAHYLRQGESEVAKKESESDEAPPAAEDETEELDTYWTRLRSISRQLPDWILEGAVAAVRGGADLSSAPTGLGGDVAEGDTAGRAAPSTGIPSSDALRADLSREQRREAMLDYYQGPSVSTDFTLKNAAGDDVTPRKDHKETPLAVLIINRDRVYRYYRLIYYIKTWAEALEDRTQFILLLTDRDPVSPEYFSTGYGLSFPVLGRGELVAENSLGEARNMDFLIFDERHNLRVKYSMTGAPPLDKMQYWLEQYALEEAEGGDIDADPVATGAQPRDATAPAEEDLDTPAETRSPSEPSDSAAPAQPDSDPETVTTPDEDLDPEA